jgi:hypothetical protein
MSRDSARRFGQLFVWGGSVDGNVTTVEVGLVVVCPACVAACGAAGCIDRGSVVEGASVAPVAAQGSNHFVVQH